MIAPKLNTGLNRRLLRCSGNITGRTGPIGLLVLTLACTSTVRSEESDYQLPSTLKNADPSLHLLQGTNQKDALQVNESIYQATGFGNTFMVVTGEGNVIIDTSLDTFAPKHRKLLRKVSQDPVHSIIITHGHGDHTGGIGLWREAGTQVIAQQNFEEFLHYQKRLEGMFAIRNAAQFGFELTPPESVTGSGNFEADIPATVLFDDRYSFSLGKLSFEVLHTPAETYDALTVWVPQFKAAFVGDMFYQSFPNMYTLRGTKPRYALDYVDSINKVLALQPEILLPSHGEPITGNAAITSALERYRDAILYVHNAVVRGMNQGKDVYTLMQEISLPAELNVSEGYGRVAWSVRGIYEGYMGWFDGNPASMYSLHPKLVYSELVDLAGGTQPVTERAAELLKQGKPLMALKLTNAVLAVDDSNQQAWAVQIEANIQLRAKSDNFNEAGWLNYGIKQARDALEETD